MSRPRVCTSVRAVWHSRLTVPQSKEGSICDKFNHCALKNVHALIPHTAARPSWGLRLSSPLYGLPIRTRYGPPSTAW